LICEDGQDEVIVIAAQHGHVEMLKYALDRDYQSKSTDPVELLFLAFIAAIYRNQQHTAQYLMQRFGLDVNKRVVGNDGIFTTPLLMAIDSGSTETALLLMELGATPEGVTDYSREARNYRLSLLKETYKRKLQLPIVYTPLGYNGPLNKVDKTIRAVHSFSKQGDDGLPCGTHRTVRE
jgi:hypothetical protein